MLEVLTAFVVGMGLPAQTAMNTRLGASLRSPLNASLVSFIEALVLLCIALALMGYAIDFDGAISWPGWIWLGGVCGVVFLTANLLALPRLGAVQTVVLPAVGQVVGGVAIDALGLFGSAESALTPLRAVCAAVLVCGAVLVASSMGEGRGGSGNGAVRSAWAWRALAVVAGMFSAAQTAINGQLAYHLGSSVAAAGVSFLIGTAALAVLAAAAGLNGRMGPGSGTTAFFQTARARSRRDAVPKGAWWMGLGGVIGALYVLAGAAMSQAIGAGSTVTSMLAGALAGSALVGWLGLFGEKRTKPTVLQALGLVLVLAGAAGVRLM